MNYRISDEMSNRAKQTIVNDEINERLIVLKNQLSFLGGDNSLKKVFNETDVNNAKMGLSKLKDLVNTLTFKKQNLEILLEDRLSKFDIVTSAKLKDEILKIDEEFIKINNSEKEFNSVIANDLIDYENQMLKIKEKYDGVDIFKHRLIDSEFSDSVIKDYKNERASKLVMQFLETLSEDKKQQVLNDNENLKGYLNVGENF